MSTQLPLFPNLVEEQEPHILNIPFKANAKIPMRIYTAPGATDEQIIQAAKDKMNGQGPAYYLDWDKVEILD